MVAHPGLHSTATVADCSFAGGAYVVEPDGLLLATTGVSTAIACNNSPLPGWPPLASRVALLHRHLVFVDTAGHVLGEARRQ